MKSVNASLETLITRHSAARGGVYRIEAIETLETIEFEVDVIEPEFRVQGKYSATREGLMRVDIYSERIPQETFRSEYHSTNGVQFPGKTEKRNLDTGEIMQTITVTSDQ